MSHHLNLSDDDGDGVDEGLFYVCLLCCFCGNHLACEKAACVYLFTGFPAII